MKNKNLAGKGPQEKLDLQLFVSGMTQKSMSAISNIRRICDEYLGDCFELEIIDIYKNPKAARDNQVVFSPSLVKNFPLPKKTLIGTFDDSVKVIKALGITT